MRTVQSLFGSKTTTKLWTFDRIFFNSPLNVWDKAIELRAVSGGWFVFFGAGFFHDFVAVL